MLRSERKHVKEDIVPLETPTCITDVNLSVFSFLNVISETKISFIRFLPTEVKNKEEMFNSFSDLHLTFLTGSGMEVCAIKW